MLRIPLVVVFGFLVACEAAEIEEAKIGDICRSEGLLSESWRLEGEPQTDPRCANLKGCTDFGFPAACGCFCKVCEEGFCLQSICSDACSPPPCPTVKPEHGNACVWDSYANDGCTYAGDGCPCGAKVPPWHCRCAGSKWSCEQKEKCPTCVTAEMLVGKWRETKQYICAPDLETLPLEKIQEVIFDDQGTFMVTWVPVETYKDYQGTYSFDAKTQSLLLSVTNRNYLPKDLDAQGTVEFIDANTLGLHNMWLGTPAAFKDDPTAKVHCGHRLERY